MSASGRTLQVVSTERVGLDALATPRDVLGAFGVYVHIPFCASRCWYCDFNAYAGMDGLIDSYCEALVRDISTDASVPVEMRSQHSSRLVSSIFLGGGTPSLLEPEQLERIVRAVRDRYEVVTNAEVSIECNPESLSQPKLEGYLQAGVNRVSIGVQQTDPVVLERLGRKHTPGAALAALRFSLELLENVSADLMFGVPGETDETVLNAVREVTDCGVSHISCYGLTYESGTPLGALRRAGKIEEVDADDAGRRAEKIDSFLAARGLARYETSNWSTEDRQCVHNLNYWRFGEYAGYGAGAHAHHANAAGSIRSWTFDSPARYIQAANDGASIAGSERLGLRQRMGEAMMLGLRETGGVPRDRFRRLCDVDLEETFGTTINRWVQAGVMICDKSSVRLTKRGSWIANDVFASFVS